MEIFLIVLGALVALVLVAGLVLGNVFYYVALLPGGNRSRVFEAEHNRSTAADGEQLERLEAAQAWLKRAGNQQVWQQSFDGLKLHAYLIENRRPSRRWLIAAHGYGGNGRQMAYPSRWFYEHGFNVLLPDARGSGRSEGKCIGMGWHDRLDYKGWIDLLMERYGDDIEIVLYGVSMGGATVMMVTGEELPPNVKAAVEDCGYSSVWEELAYQMKKLVGLPPFPTMYFASMVTWLRAGWRLGQASAVAQVAKSKTPTLFIHGDRDRFVPSAMLDKVYTAAACEKERMVVPGAGHTEAANVAGEEYWERVEAFLGRHL